MRWHGLRVYCQYDIWLVFETRISIHFLFQRYQTTSELIPVNTIHTRLTRARGAGGVPVARGLLVRTVAAYLSLYVRVRALYLLRY